MKSFIALCALLALVAADPDPSVAIAPAFNYYPATPYYQAIPNYYPGYLKTPYIPAAPIAYAGAAHLIKKRSVTALPYASTYLGAAPLATTYNYGFGYNQPLTHISTPYVSTVPAYTHLIKKRSVAALPIASSYIAPSYPAYSTYSAPYYNAAPFYSSQYFGAYPAYAQYIKK